MFFQIYFTTLNDICAVLPYMKSWFQSFSVENFLISLTRLSSINFVLYQFFNNLVFQVFEEILWIRWKKHNVRIGCFDSYLFIFYYCIVPNKLNYSLFGSYKVVGCCFKFGRKAILRNTKYIVKNHFTLVIFLFGICIQNQFREIIL